MRKIAMALLLVCASMAIWVGCSNTISGRYLYAAIPQLNELIVFREDPNSGALTELVGSPITAGQSVHALVIHPSKKFMYAANSGENDISLFTITDSGALTEASIRTNSGGTGPTVLAIDPAGSYLYVGNSGSFDISVFSIDPTSGVLTAVPQLSGGTAAVGLSPLNIAIAPSSSTLYVTGQGFLGYVEAFPLNGGVLGSPLTDSPYQAGNNPYGLAISPDGSFLYTANKLDSSISEFPINADGSLGPQLAGSPIQDAYLGPVALLIDPSGTYLYTANQGSTNLAGFSIGSGGALNLLPSSPFATSGSNPSVIATDHSGSYLFVANQTSSGSSVESFSLNKSNGTLTVVATYPLPGTATSLVLTK